jgi:ribosome maturation factor RimP
MGRAADRDSLRRLLEPIATEHDLDLEEVEVTAAGRRRVLRVVVDADGGVGLDTVADLSTAVSSALDDGDVMGAAPYVLEVTTPGVDRPLTEPKHWRRARGRLVLAALADGTEVTGRVRDADDRGVRLDVAGDPRELAWDEVRRGTVQVEFNRPDGAGPEEG